MSKNPHEFTTGDTTVSKLVTELAAESFSVSQVALTVDPQLLGNHNGIYGVPKPPPSLTSIAYKLATKLRSPVHARFDIPNLSRRIEQSPDQSYVAEHSYMAESALTSGVLQRNLYINTHVSESDVYRNGGKTSGRVMAPLILRDELRVARRAKRIACFDGDEIQRYERAGLRDVQFLPLTLRPAEKAKVAGTEKQLVFVGDQRWPPNRQAIERLAYLWPRIQLQVPGARLKIIGKPDPNGRPWHFPPSVEEAGFVDDLSSELSSSRAMVAPLAVGGGVRVKILEAISVGLPVVSTTTGWGSLAGLFDMTGCDSDDLFIDECVRYLSDPSYAAKVGRELYDANWTLWEERVAARAVESWLA
ncbi:glycosyltransferase [Gordonia rubripertincta]|uniref:Glycosyltransferase n=2 Tax=Gordonia rubripertincta TaxID=36822 RepID=A0AAW6RHN3_GORRU|nr:glycosyltransferase [Gordonia rubripertincta]MDG6783823.1 glycosyltransferase [Gordonia rubripertincta]NKY64411.1 glycosyltransferase [Gordonia rubripertincta]